jgi:hypothetical protein
MNKFSSKLVHVTLYVLFDLLLILNQNVFLEESGVFLEDVDFCDTRMILTLRQGRKLRLCSVNLPLPENIKVSALSLYMRELSRKAFTFFGFWDLDSFCTETLYSFLI